MAEFTTLLDETFEGARHVKAYGMEAHETARAESIIGRLYKLGVRSVRTRAVAEPLLEVIAGIAPMDSEERFTGLGCKVIRAPARFLNPREVEAGGMIITARRFVIATGSSAAIPPIAGLVDTDHAPFRAEQW